MADDAVPPADRFRRWRDRWLGPILLVFGLLWLGLTPSMSGSSGVQVLRWVVGIVWVVSGIVLTVQFRRARRQ
jgi:uncharacterized membrane protein HdeD (DUF308 family)